VLASKVRDIALQSQPVSVFTVTPTTHSACRFQDFYLTGAGALTGSFGVRDGAGTGCGTAGFGIASGMSIGCEPGWCAHIMQVLLLEQWGEIASRSDFCISIASFAFPLRYHSATEQECLAISQTKEGDAA
jgi:hypothetical protein